MNSETSDPQSLRTRLFTPTTTQIEHSNLKRFTAQIRSHLSLPAEISSQTLYAWSLENPQIFWEELWKFFTIQHSKKYEAVLTGEKQMSDTHWFTGAKLNFSENLLRFNDDLPALTFCGEGAVRRKLSYRELHQQVASIAYHLRTLGVGQGDRVAACIANMPEAIVTMLATTAIGAIWSSCSPDFGVDGIVDRFNQIAPKVLLCCDGYFFKGKPIDCRDKITVAVSQLPSVKNIILVDYIGLALPLIPGVSVDTFSDLLSTSASLNFEQLPSEHPVYILFSSGTTGKPKCIVHGAIGTLLEQRKELEIHCDLKRSDVFFYQTTCGWMMWNWLVAGLAAGAHLVLYDGAPLHEDSTILFRIADEEKITVFGTNAKTLAILEKNGVSPKKQFDLSSIRLILSTGSVLSAESFDYVYREISASVQLGSISGGTDILGCFALCAPDLPVHRGHLQTRSLGLAVEVYNQEGKSVVEEQGELVCTKPFPSMPIGFWGDDERSKLHQAYFSTFTNVWAHGDFVTLLKSGEMIFHGRSDATLNPGGIRIGTAEIYAQVEKIPQIIESLVVAKRHASDEQIVLFVVLAPGQHLTDEIKQNIRTIVRQNLTAFHVPQHIFAVSELPRTRSGKIVELAVRDIIHGHEIKNLTALANPEALNEFRAIGIQLDSIISS